MTDRDIFDKAMGFTLGAEAGYWVDPNVGPTNRGVTQTTFDKWRKDNGKPTEDVKEISEQEARDIYYQNFWKRPNIDMLAEALPATAIAVFDFYLNVSHPKEVVQFLQRRIQVMSDGIIGAITARMAKQWADANGGDLVLALKFNQDRRAWVESKGAPQFQHGVLNRVNHLDEYLKNIFYSA